MGRYQGYPEYRESGVEWLGEVPEHWVVKKLKYICDIQTGTKDTVNAIDNGYYPFFVRSQTVERINSMGADCEAVLTAGDGVGVGKVFHYINGKFDFHQRVYMLNNFSGVLGRFVYYYLLVNFYKVALEGYAKSTVDSLRLPQFLNFEFSFPDRSVQKKILAFLDHETAKIDTLIEKQQTLIALLKEKRQAVISHAVTKGLNPDVPMRDSGVEWLGEVPEGWVTINFGITNSSVALGGNYSAGEGEEGIPLIKMGNLGRGKIDIQKLEFLPKNESYDEGHLLNFGDFLFNTRNSLNLVGKVSIWRGEIEKALYNSNILKIKFNEKFINNTEFMSYLFNSDLGLSQLRLIAKGTTSVAAIYYKELKSLVFAIPPISQQTDIVYFLDNEIFKLEKLIQQSEIAIELMQERRTALISAAVTGKIDVRNWQAPAQDQPNSVDAA